MTPWTEKPRARRGINQITVTDKRGKRKWVHSKAREVGARAAEEDRMKERADKEGAECATPKT